MSTRVRINDNTTRVLEHALRSGGKMHAFLSGGGLRVVRIEACGDLVAYGEHPVMSDALRICAEDFLCGGRKYKDVYGSVETHYLTGQSEPDGDLDALVRKSGTFDASFGGGVFLFELHGFEQHEAPAGVQDRATAGETVRYTDDRGMRFVASPSRFPNGERCYSVSVEFKPENMKGEDVWMWRSVRKGAGTTLIKAIESAFISRSGSEGP